MKQPEPISGCGRCMHGAWYGTRDVLCEHKDIVNARAVRARHGPADSIPSWCPLPDAKVPIPIPKQFPYGTPCGSNITKAD